MEFSNIINKIINTNKNIRIFLDMDGTIVENIYDLDKSFEKKGGYIKKRPIKPIIKEINKIIESYKYIEINILSCSSNDRMTKEKNEWLDMYMPNIKKENRIFLVKEKGEYTKNNIYKVKSEYIKNNISNDDIVILVDDDNWILSESQKILGQQVIPIHVTTLLI